MQEGSADIEVDEGKISRKLAVFYNPVMKTNRDLSIELLKVISEKDLRVALPLAGSGIRGIRFLKELPKEKISEVLLNDYSEEAVERITRHLKKNKVKAEVFKKEANQFLLSQKAFDYIDIDPFGYPGPFLDAAVKKIKNQGILAVTATDTAALCGTYPNACKRKYWAVPKRGSIQHEVGLRILIRRVQLVGVTYEKALIPVMSYSKDHYMRVMFRCERGKKKCDALLKKHTMFKEAGPLWAGKLQQKTLLKKMKHEFAQQLHEELDVLGFYHVHNMCKSLKKPVPKFDWLFEHVKKKGHKITRTHFDNVGIKTDMPEDEFLKLLS